MKNIDADNLYPNEITHLNIGTGDDISIADLTLMIKEISGFKGNIKFESEKPDGVSKKLLNTKRINYLGWEYSTNLEIGLQLTYDWYLENNT
jgi:GDP-L-fucose synthase